MCGIAGLFSKSSAVEETPRRAPERDARAARRPRARQRRRRLLPRSGAGRVVQGLALLAGPEDTWRELARELAESFGEVGEPEVRASHALFVVERTPASSAALARRAASRAARDERRRADRDLQGGRATRAGSSSASGSRRFRHATRSATPGWRPRAASPPSTRTRSRPGSTSAWSTTARSPTTTGCASSCAARGSSSRPTTTPRSRPATSPGGCARATTSRRRSSAASTTSTASTPSPSARPTASPCCATRSPASRR